MAGEHDGMPRKVGSREDYSMGAGDDVGVGGVFVVRDDYIGALVSSSTQKIYC